MRSTEIEALLVEHERRRRCCLSLVASENRMSAAVLRAGASDAANRYTIPARGERPEAIWDYPNQAGMVEIERRTRQLARDLFGAGYADVRPLSGNNAVFSVLAALAPRGSRVLHVPADCGGHFATPPIAELLGLELVPIPYDRARGVVDVDATARAFAECRPALVLFDASMVVFPPPLVELRAALGVSAVISVDISHPMGVIGGGEYQQPLAEGADLMHGSTHKSLFGPQKGIVLCREDGDVARRIAATVVPTFASNIHSHHVAALGVALEEMHAFGRAYARQVVANAKALAAELASCGVEVYGEARGFTACHQIWVRLGARSQAETAMRDLEDAGIFANAIAIPFAGDHGLRMGVSELTRRGMEEGDLREVARLVAPVLRGTLSPGAARPVVEALSLRFRELAFA